MREQKKRFYDFGPYRLDPAKRVLLKDGAQVQLTPKAFDTLLALVEERGRLLQKDVLINRIWPDSFVEEGNLTVTISMLRKALGENRGEHRYIVTIPGKGYRFVADVRELWDETAELVLEEHTREHFVVEQEEVKQLEIAKPAVDEQGGILVRDTPVNNLKPVRLSRKALALCALMLVLLSAIAFSLLRPNKPMALEPTTIRKRSIAVLPFKLISAKPDAEHLGLGLADILITKLSNIQQITVRPTSAVRKYNEVDQNPVIAGQELKVDSVLQGSVQQQEGKIRITVQLINVEDGSPLWADKFDESFTNIFAVQDTISEQVARMLAVKLSSKDKELLAKKYTQNAEAHQLYLKGRYFWEKRSADNLEKSIKYFKEALEKDPVYALAYAGLADSYALLASGGGEYSMHTSDAISKARTYVMKALELDETLADAHTSLGIIHLNYDWDWASAEREFTRALELNSGSSNAHYWYSLYLSAMGRGEEAIAESKLAAEIDPLSPLTVAQVARAFNYADQFDQAIIECRKALELDPNRAVAHYTLGMAYRGLKRYPEAIAEFNKVIPFAEGSPVAIAALGAVYALSGNRPEAEKILADLIKQEGHGYVSPYYFIDLYACLGDKDRAFKWIDKSYEERAGFLAYTKVEDIFDNLRDDPRYSALMQRLGLAQ